VVRDSGVGVIGASGERVASGDVVGVGSEGGGTEAGLEGGGTEAGAEGGVADSGASDNGSSARDGNQIR
jgi:hypothetical protein